MDKIYILIFLFLFSTLLADVNFEFLCELIKINQSDNLTNIQLFDYNFDGSDEIIASYITYDYFRIVCYSQNGTILQSFTQEIQDILLFSTSFVVFENEENIEMLLSYSTESITEFLLYDFNTFAVLDSVSHYFGEWFFVENYSDILRVNVDNENIFYIGTDIFFAGIYEETYSKTFKLTYDGSDLEIIEIINEYGSDLIYNSESNIVIATGVSSIAGIDAWPWANKDSRLGLLSADYYSDIQNIMTVEGSATYSEPPVYNNFPTNLFVLTKRNDNFQNSGFVLSYRTTDTDDGIVDHFRCFSSDLSEQLWYSTDSNIGSFFINSSTCVSVNNEDQYIMYFRDNQLEIRNRLNGEVIYYQQIDFTPSEILRSSADDVLFFSEAENDSCCLVYRLSEDIYVDSYDNLLPPKNCGLSIYPNPFNPNAQISFSINQDSQVTLIVWDVKGRVVDKLSENYFSAGQHVIAWNAIENGDLSSGIYLLNLEVDGELKAVGKCVLLK